MLKSRAARPTSRCFHQLCLLKDYIKSLPFEAARAAVAASVTLQDETLKQLLVGMPRCLLD